MICPSCLSNGITQVPEGLTHHARREPTHAELADRIFVPAASRALDKAARALDGKQFSAHIRCPDGVIRFLHATIHYRGAHCRPLTLEVQYSNGAVENRPVREVQALLQGATTSKGTARTRNAKPVSRTR